MPTQLFLVIVGHVLCFYGLLSTYMSNGGKDTTLLTWAVQKLVMACLVLRLLPNAHSRQ